MVRAVFDDPNLIASAGLVPLVALAQQVGLTKLADKHLSVPTDKGANAGLKVTSLVAGMAAGADSIDDMALLRHGGMSKVFDRPYAPSTLGQFLRKFTFGHVRQLDAIASRVLINLAGATPVLTGIDKTAIVDIDDTIIQVHGYTKQGSGYGYSKVRGLNALLATVTTDQGAPVIVAQRLRKGSTGSPRGAARLVADALKAVSRIRSDHAQGPVLVRADSAFYGSPTIGAAVKAGADVSVTVRMTSNIKAAIATISSDAWTPIEYTDAIFDETTGTWVSKAEVAEVDFTAFASKKKSQQVPGRLVVRRIPELNPGAKSGRTRCSRYGATTRSSPRPTPRGDTVAADKTHRAHARIENVHADLKNSALAHLPSSSFTANSAWLVLAVMAFNLTRAAATITGPALAKATTGTIRRTLITVPARIASSARRLTLHLPQHWPWEEAWTALFTTTARPPPAATS